MKKSTAVVGVVVLLGAAYLGTSWYMGQQAELKIREGVMQANQEAVKLLGVDVDTQGMVIAIQDYQRGWFSSDAVYTLTTKDADGQPVELKFTDHLQHGPFPVAALKAGDFMPMLAYSQAKLLATPVVQTWFDSQDGVTPLRAETRVGLGGKGQSVWTFSAVDYDQDDTHLTFSGGVVTVDLSNDFKNSVSHGQFDSLRFLDRESGETLGFNQVEVNSVSTTTDEQTQLKSSATMASLTLSGEEEFLADKVIVGLDSVQQGSLLDSSIRYEFGRLVAGDADLGGLDFTVNLARLDLDALTDLMTAYDKIRVEQGLEPDETPELSVEQQALLQEKLLAILAAKPALSIDPLIWKNSAGQTTASLLVDLAAPDNADTALADPLTALTEILSKVQLDLSVPRAMFIQAFAQLQGDAGSAEDNPLGAMLYDQYVNSFQEAGLVTVDADGAKLAMLYQDGEIVVNDQKMPLQNFLMLMMMLGM